MSDDAVTGTQPHVPTAGGRVTPAPAQAPPPPDVAVDETPPKPLIGTRRVMRTNDPEGDARAVAVLTGALPWLREFHGNVVVVKYGGRAMVGDECPRGLAEGKGFLRPLGVYPGG